jgi:hypothetical protein
LLACTLLLTACSNPEKSAQSAIDEIQKAWQGETADLDPEKRLQHYDEIIQAAETVSNDYPRTSYGKAITAGRTVNGTSLVTMKHVRYEFAPRAACYANLSVGCLRPFSSKPAGNAGSSINVPNDVFAAAQQLV